KSRVAGGHYWPPAPSEPYGRVFPHTARAFTNASRETRLAPPATPDGGPGGDSWHVTASRCTSHRCPPTPATRRGDCASTPPTAAPGGIPGICLLGASTGSARLSDPRGLGPSWPRSAPRNTPPRSGHTGSPAGGSSHAGGSPWRPYDRGR